MILLVVGTEGDTKGQTLKSKTLMI
eukprot:COSAG02_NODE_23073_length_731_cov_0.892405_3_plen_24_part_01